MARGVSPAQILNEIIEESCRAQDLLPDATEREEEVIAELNRLQKTVLQLNNDLHAHHLLLESYQTTTDANLRAQQSALNVGRLLGNAQYKLLGLVYESQMLMQQLLVQCVIEPHLKGLDDKVNIEHLLAVTHAPE